VPSPNRSVGIRGPLAKWRIKAIPEAGRTVFVRMDETRFNTIKHWDLIEPGPFSLPSDTFSFAGSCAYYFDRHRRPRMIRPR
jgi:hypothetical protein